MSQRYKINRIRKQTSYSIPEICDLLAVHKNTVRGWIRDGLPKTDKQKPFLVYGNNLREFLQMRQKSRQKKCELHEFFCFRCQTQRKLLGNLADVKTRTNKIVNVSGFCEVCETAIHKAQSVKDLPKIFQIFDIPKLVQKHIYDSTTHSLNCNLRKDDET